MIDEPKYPEQRFILGMDVVTKQEISLTPKQFSLGGYIVGSRGSGKSKQLLSLIMQSIKQGRGLCLIDPHSDLLKEVVARIPKHRMNDVIYLDPLDADGAFPFGLNIFHCENKKSPKAVERTVSLVMDLFKKLWPSESAQPLVEDVLRLVTRTIIANEMTMMEIDPLLNDTRFREQLLKNVTNPAVLSFWRTYANPKSLEREQGASTVTRRVRQFTSSEIIGPIVGQDRPKLNLTDVMDKHRILLVRLNSGYGEITSLIGSTIIGQFLQIALARSDIDEKYRADFDLYCDEFGEFAIESFAKIIDQGRKFNINPFLSHQTRGQVNERIQDSVIQLGSFFCFKVIGKDAEELSVNFDATPVQASERQKTIPSDVLMHLTDHEEEYVKTFERQHVRKLLQAKALHVGKEQGEYYPRGSKIYEPIKMNYPVYPKFIFDDEEIEFEPNDLLKFLEMMETFLYQCMFTKNVDMDQFNKVMIEWGFACSGMFQPTEKGRRYRLKKEDYAPSYAEEIDRMQQRFKDRYERFKTDFLRVAFILMHEPIYVYPSTRPNENTSQQSYADRRNQIANELAQLPPRTMKVKIPSGEFTLETPLIPNVGETGKLAKIITYSREHYCEERAVVEEQIAKRQQPPAPPIVPRHTV